MRIKLPYSVFFLLLFASAAAGAQGLVPKRGDLGYAGTKVFEYPKQVLDYKGKKVEAFANVIYRYDAELGMYTQLTLRMCFLPLDTKGFPPALQDSIAKYARQSTVVCHSGIMRKKPRQKIKGKADMFAKAFSVESDNRDAQAKVSYSAVFDPESPARCRISYKISPTTWDAPDETVEFTPTSDETVDSWQPAIHDVGKWDYRYRKPEHMYYLRARIECRAPRKPADFTGNMHVEKCDSVYMNVTPSLEGFNTGTGQRGATIFEGDLFRQYAFSRNGSEGVCAQGSLQVAPGNYLPFMDREKTLWFDYRARAKCCRLNNNLVMEQVSFSCLFHY